MNFDPNQIDLPVREVLHEAKAHLETTNTLLLSAPPGAGKSTLFPLALLGENWLKGQKIILLEPRRLAARAIASRMSSLLNEEIGQTVGYRIRFDSRISSGTRIEVVTEGILTRMLQSDNALEGVGAVIFDEFHERNLFADVALALCRESQQLIRPDLRIIIMSATLDLPGLSQLLQSPVIESKGKQYPVEVIYTGDRDMMLIPELTARVTYQASKENKGDILVFLPGEAEIRKCETLLTQQLKEFAIHPLYGQLTQSQQISAILPNRQGKRKIVLATSIAETSLTIEGITVVVDSGYGRTMKFDPRSGLSRLTTIEISKDSADQRAGRAGRLAPGKCYRMWTKATHEKLADHRTPEIVESDLSSLFLDMAQWGVTDILQMTWMTPPPKGHLLQASDLLHQIGALENNRITVHGKQLLKLPCHPRIAHMLVCAQDDHLLPLATDVAAILEERDPLSRDAGIDINLRIEALRRYRQSKKSASSFDRIERTAESYRKMFNINAENTPVDPFQTGLVLVHAYPERIACARPGNNAQFQLANGSIAMAGHTDDLAHEPWLAVAHMDAREGMGKIFMAAPLNPKDLASMVKEKDIITWDTRKGGLIATHDLRIGSITLQSKPLHTIHEEQKITAICNVIEKEGENLLDFNEDVTQWQNRIISLSKWNADQNWPDVSLPNLLQTNSEWLAPYLQNIRKNEDLKKLDLHHILHNSLDWNLQQLLEQLAPERITVPSGSKIKVQYMSNGDSPILAVRLQELFGLAETPTINNGKTPLVMHLLSPGFKPVQVTSDLKSFWNHTYFEVKKELRTRYPKHVWPDDPWKEQPIRGIKRKES